MLEFITKLFKRKNKYDKYLDNLQNIHKKVILDPIPLPSTYDPSKPTILITDDHEGVIYILEYTINDIEEAYTDFNKDDYNFIFVSSIYAIHRIFEFLKDVKIDYLITDLTFGGRVPNDNNEMIGYDGVDLILKLKEQNLDLKWMVFTGHIIGRRSHKLDNTHAKKIYDIDGTLLYNKTYFKDDVDFNRNKVIYDFIKTGEYNREDILIKKRTERMQNQRLRRSKVGYSESTDITDTTVRDPSTVEGLLDDVMNQSCKGTSDEHK